MKLSYTESIPVWLRTRANEMISRSVDLTNKYVHVTQLISPAPMLRLQDEHWAELEVSPDDLIPAMLGAAWHQYLEGAEPGGYVEQRIETMCNDWCVIGSPDWYSTAVIRDYKTTKVWSRIFGKREWEEQLNVYRWLIHQSTGIEVPRLEIHVIYTDWTANGLKRIDGHPPKRWEVIDVPVWPMDDTDRFIKARLAAIEEVQAIAETPLPDPYCTPEERWERGECWAVMRLGRKSAMPGGLKDTQEEAAEMAATVTGGYVEHRPGNPVRCKDWCSVRRFCDFGKTLEMDR